jgi:hypothetical protein
MNKNKKENRDDSGGPRKEMANTKNLPLGCEMLRLSTVWR